MVTGLVFGNKDKNRFEGNNRIRQSVLFPVEVVRLKGVALIKVSIAKHKWDEIKGCKGGSSMGRRGVGWQGEEKAGCEGHTSGLRQTRAHKHRQRSHSHPHHQILRQTGGKMLYFPSKLKCQLILMWKWRLSDTQHEDTQTLLQTALTLTHRHKYWISNLAWSITISG